MVADALHDAEWSGSTSVVNLRLQSVMCAPLTARGEVRERVLGLEAGGAIEVSGFEQLLQDIAGEQDREATAASEASGRAWSRIEQLAEALRDRLGDSVVLVGSEAAGKAQLVLVVSKSLTARYSAGQLIRPIAELLGVPKGTVFSRLSAARQAFQASLARQKARDVSPARASGGQR